MTAPTRERRAEAGNRIKITPGEIHPSRIYEPAEILILGQEDSTFRQRQLHQLLVHRTVLKLTYREHIMPIVTERSNYCEVAAFVRKETH